MKKSKMLEVMRLAESLAVFGFTADDVDGLLRIERTLHRWAEQECGDGNGMIGRDETTGKPFWRSYSQAPEQATAIPDRESGALAKLAKIMAGKRGVVAYHQGDPRGCALYIVRTADIPKGERVDAYYSRGVAVCI